MGLQSLDNINNICVARGKGVVSLLNWSFRVEKRGMPAEWLSRARVEGNLREECNRPPFGSSHLMI